MSTKVSVLRIILIVQIVSALRILPQDTKGNENSREPALLKVIDGISKTGSVDQDKRRSSYAQKMLMRHLNHDLTSLNQFETNHSPRVLRQIAAEPLLSPQKKLQAQTAEDELKKMSDISKSALLGRPYVEKKGRNDYLVIQSENSDPFVTVIPNSIYYNVEKHCVNWLDACSLRGIRAHLLERVQSPYK